MFCKKTCVGIYGIALFCIYYLLQDYACGREWDYIIICHTFFYLLMSHLFDCRKKTTKIIKKKQFDYVVEDDDKPLIYHKI